MAKSVQLEETTLEMLKKIQNIEEVKRRGKIPLRQIVDEIAEFYLKQLEKEN